MAIPVTEPFSARGSQKMVTILIEQPAIALKIAAPSHTAEQFQGCTPAAGLVFLLSMMHDFRAMPWVSASPSSESITLK